MTPRIVVALFAVLLASQVLLPAQPSPSSRPSPTQIDAETGPSHSATTLKQPAGGPRPFSLLPVGSELGDIVIDPVLPRAYVTDRANARVLVVDLENEAISTAIPVRAGPVTLAIDPSANTLYVGHAENRSIAAIDLASLTVARILETTFLTWGLVAPTDDSLVATTHDDQWTGQFPYVLNATTGQVLQRLCSGSFCNMFYQDTLVALSRNRTSLVLAESALQHPIFLVKYERLPSETAWTEMANSRGNAWSQTGGEARDLVFSPDGDLVFLATNMSSLIVLNATDLQYVHTLGTFAHSYSIAISSAGAPIALSAADNSIIPEFSLVAMRLDGQRAILQYPIQGAVHRLRISADGLRFVATTGSASAQDIAILRATAISPEGVPLSGYSNLVRPLLSSQIAVFASPAQIGVTLEVDGTPLPVSVNLTLGLVEGSPSFDLAEATHTLLTRILYSGVEETSRSRDFVVDLTPPVILFDPYSNVTDQEHITITGRVVDRNPPLYVNASGQWVTLKEGRFSATVRLERGPNEIPFFVYDRANNSASAAARVEFQPPKAWFLQPAKHFRIPVPYLWTASGNVTAGGATVDVLIMAPNEEANIVVSSEARAIEGTAVEARSILEEALSNLSSLPDFRILDPVTERAIGGHPAVWATVTWQPSTYNVVQVVVVVVSGEWDMYWALAGTTFSWFFGKYLVVFNETIANFDILPLELGLRILAGALAVGGVGAAVLFVLVIGRHQRKRPS